MSWLDSSKTSPTDFEIELLLRRTPTLSDELADLELFVAALDQRAPFPRDTEFMAVALAASARAARPAPRTSFRRVVAITASVAMLFALSGVAMAADDAVPGDLLYGLDRALEQFGIGDGGVDERIVEFDSLMESGDEELAFELLDDFATSAPQAEADKVERHLELAEVMKNPSAAGTQNKVADQQEFIEQNKGGGAGADGKEFGTGVAEQAQPDAVGQGGQSESGKSEKATDQYGKDRAPKNTGKPEK